MSRVPRKAPEPEHRAPTVRIPVGATLFLLAVATIYPGLFFLLGTLAYVCVHLVALGATSGLLPLGFAVVVLSAVTRSIPRRLKRFGFPRPRVTSALLLGATIAGVAQLVVLTFHAPFPFATFPPPVAVPLHARGAGGRRAAVDPRVPDVPEPLGRGDPRPVAPRDLRGVGVDRGERRGTARPGSVRILLGRWTLHPGDAPGAGAVDGRVGPTELTERIHPVTEEEYSMSVSGHGRTSVDSSELGELGETSPSFFMTG